MFTKPETIRAFLTKVLQDGKWVEVAFPTEFWGTHSELFDKLKANSHKLPSLQFVEDKYKFKKLESDYNLHDLTNLLSDVFLRDTALDVAKKMGTITGDVVGAAHELNGFIEQLTMARQIAQTTRTVDLKRDLSYLMSEYERGLNQSPILTGFDAIDEMSPFMRGQMNLVLGATNRGKTLVLIHLLNNFRRKGLKTTLFNMELSEVQVLNRMLVDSGAFNYDELRRGEISSKDWGAAVSNLSIDGDVVLVTRKSDAKISLQTVEDKIKKERPDVAIIDYLTLLDDTDFHWDSAVDPGAKLKQLALTYDCLVIGAVQSNDVMPDEMPKLDNIARAKHLGWSADIVLAMNSQRQGRGGDNGPTRLLVDFEVQKSRDGGFPTFGYLVTPTYGIWKSFDPVEQALAANQMAAQINAGNR